MDQAGTMRLLEGKRGIIFGIANERSYAWYISKALMEAGAQCLFTHLPDDKGKMRARCLSAINALGIEDPWLEPCDASSDDDLDTVFTRIRARFEKIDFIVHSIAFADRQFLQIGNFHKTTREAWTTTALRFRGLPYPVPVPNPPRRPSATSIT